MGLEELILTSERKLGQIEGERRGINQVVMNMLRKNLADDMIADFVDVTPDYVREIRISLN